MIERIQRRKMNFYTETYKPEYSITPSFHPRVKTIAELVGESMNVLDVGCFDGTMGSALKKYSNVVFGMELSRQAIVAAQKKGVRVVLADADETFPFADRSFDAIFAGEIIEHVIDVDYFLDEIARVLRLDGHVVITTPNLASLGRRFLLLLGRDPLTNQSMFSGAGHVRYFVRATLTELLEQHNLKIIDFRSDVVNINIKGNIFSTKLARWVPSWGRGLIVKAKLLNAPIPSTVDTAANHSGKGSLETKINLE